MAKWWLWGRSHDAFPTRSASAAAPPEAAWRRLPTVQCITGDIEPTAPLDDFTASLTTAQSPGVVAPPAATSIDHPDELPVLTAVRESVSASLRATKPSVHGVGGRSWQPRAVAQRAHLGPGPVVQRTLAPTPMRTLEHTPEVSSASVEPVGVSLTEAPDPSELQMLPVSTDLPDDLKPVHPETDEPSADVGGGTGATIVSTSEVTAATATQSRPTGSAPAPGSPTLQPTPTFLQATGIENSFPAPASSRQSAPPSAVNAKQPVQPFLQRSLPPDNFVTPDISAVRPQPAPAAAKEPSVQRVDESGGSPAMTSAAAATRSPAAQVLRVVSSPAFSEAETPPLDETLRGAPMHAATGGPPPTMRQVTNVAPTTPSRLQRETGTGPSKPPQLQRDNGTKPATPPLLQRATGSGAVTRSVPLTSFAPSPPAIPFAVPTTPAALVGGDPPTPAEDSPMATLSRLADAEAPTHVAQRWQTSAEPPTLQRLALQPPVRRIPEPLAAKSVQADLSTRFSDTQAGVRQILPSLPTAVQRSEVPMVAPIEELMPGGRTARVTTPGTTAVVPGRAGTGRLVILPPIQRSASEAGDGDAYQPARPVVFESTRPMSLQRMFGVAGQTGTEATAAAAVPSGCDVDQHAIEFAPEKVQRAAETATPLPEPSPNGVPAQYATAPAPTTPAAPAPGAPPIGDVDELVNRLYDALAARLRTELWLDRERAGVLMDLGR